MSSILFGGPFVFILSTDGVHEGDHGGRRLSQRVHVGSKFPKTSLPVFRVDVRLRKRRTNRGRRVCTVIERTKLFPIVNAMDFLDTIT